MCLHQTRAVVDGGSPYSTVAKQYVEVSKWSVRMEVDMTNRASTRQILKYRIGLVLSGLRMAYELGDMFKQYIYLFSYLRRPLPPSKIRTLCQCLEMIKAIQYTFHRQSATLGESIAFMTQQMQFTLQRQFLPIKQNLSAAKKFSAQSLDNLSAANLALQMLNGCATDDRRLLLRLAMHVLFQLVRHLPHLCAMEQERQRESERGRKRNLMV